jgi:hypothetical protein
MRYSDKRVPGIWQVGDVIVDTNDQRYLVIKHQADDVLLGQVSLLSVTTSFTYTTANSLAQLRTDFLIGNVVHEVIPAVDVVLEIVSE